MINRNNNIGAKISPKNFNPFYFAGPEILEFKIRDRQTDKYFDTIYKCVWIISSSYICYLPTRFTCRGINSNRNSFNDEYCLN